MFHFTAFHPQEKKKKKGRVNSELVDIALLIHRTSLCLPLGGITLFFLTKTASTSDSVLNADLPAISRILSSLGETISQIGSPYLMKLLSHTVSWNTPAVHGHKTIMHFCISLLLFKFVKLLGSTSRPRP